MHNVAQPFLLDLSKPTDSDTTIYFLLKDKSSNLPWVELQGLIY